MAMPVTAPASTSVMPPTRLLTSAPTTAPLAGAVAPFSTAGRLNALSAKTGASLTAVTVMATVSVSCSGVPALSVDTMVKVSAPL